MNRLTPVKTKGDIFPEYQDTPVGRLLEYHNLDRKHENYAHAELLVGMCMDHRKRLRIPENFSYIIRTGGANMQYSDFHISFGIAVGGVKSIALIGHTKCGMVNLNSKKDTFIDGLAKNAGWEKVKAKEQFDQLASTYEIGNEVDFTLSETQRIKARYPKVQVAPLIYQVEDNLLYQIQEN